MAHAEVTLPTKHAPKRAPKMGTQRLLGGGTGVGSVPTTASIGLPFRCRSPSKRPLANTRNAPVHAVNAPSRRPDSSEPGRRTGEKPGSGAEMDSSRRPDSNRGPLHYE